MTPSSLFGYFSASSTVAGTLIGLLFVAITLRYDQILGGRAHRRNRAVAGSAFTALTNALSLSLWALLRSGNLGYAAAAIAMISLYTTVRLHRSPPGQGETSLVLFALSTAVYLFELGSAITLIQSPRNAAAVYDLAFVVFGALAAALSRSWQLLQDEADAGATDPAGPPS